MDKDKNKVMAQMLCKLRDDSHDMPKPSLENLAIKLRETARKYDNWTFYILGWAALYCTSRFACVGGLETLKFKPCASSVEYLLGVDANIFFSSIQRRADFVHCRPTTFTALAIRCPAMYKCKMFNNMPLIDWFLKNVKGMTHTQKTTLAQQNPLWCELLS